MERGARVSSAAGARDVRGTIAPCVPRRSGSRCSSCSDPEASSDAGADADAERDADTSPAAPGDADADVSPPHEPSLTIIAGEPGGFGSEDGADPRFGGPLGIDVGPDGTVYVAERDNRTIRRLVPDGAGGYRTETLAGRAYDFGDADGSGAEARFLEPADVAYGNGVVYVADIRAQTIRAVVAATGATTTLVRRGAGDDPMAAPYGLAFDGERTLYVSDYGQHVVHAVDAVTGAHSVFTGRYGTPGNVGGGPEATLLSSPSGLALDGGYLYVANAGTGAIVRVEIATRIAQSAWTAVDRPIGLAVGNGVMYATEGGAPRVRALAIGLATAPFLTAGNLELGTRDGLSGDARFVMPGFMAIHDGKLFVPDTAGQSIRTIELEPGAAEVHTIAGRPIPDGSFTTPGGYLLRPTSLALAEDGDVFIADSDHHVIRRYRRATDVLETVAGAIDAPDYFDSDDPARARFRKPTSIVYRPPSTLFVADYNNHAIRKIDLPSGAVTTVAGGRLPLDPDELLVGGYVEGTVDVARLNQPYALALGPDALYFSDYGNLRIRVLTLSGTPTVRLVAGGGSQLEDSVGGSAQLRAFSLLYAEPCTATETENCYASEADEGPLLFFGDDLTPRVRKVVLRTAEVHTVAGTRSRGHVDGAVDIAQVDLVGGFCFDGRGGLLLADFSGHSIRALSLADRVVTTLLGDPMRGRIDTRPPFGLAYPIAVARDDERTLVLSYGENVLLEWIP